MSLPPGSHGTHAPATLADLADFTGSRPVATVLHRSPAATLTLLSLPPDVVFPHHSAPRDAAVLGISGAATVDFGDERAAVTVGVGVPLPAGRGHSVEAGPEGAVLLLVVSHSA